MACPAIVLLCHLHSFTQGFRGCIWKHGINSDRHVRKTTAEKSLLKAQELAPATPDYLHALAILYAEQNQWARAIAVAERLVQQFPREPAFSTLLEQLRRQSTAQRAE